MKFVLLSPRRGQEVLKAEYQDFCRFTGLSTQELEQRPLDTADAQLGTFTNIQGVFIGGSPFTITDPYEPLWQESVSQRLVNFAKEQLNKAGHGIPIFSTCYGSSMFAHYLGGMVSQEYSESAGVSTAIVTTEGRHDPLTKDLPDSFHAMTGHKDSVIKLPPHATLLLTSKRCPVQMYRLGSQIWVSQFHPEMDGHSIQRRLSFYEDEGYAPQGKLTETYAALLGHDTSAAHALLKNFVNYCMTISQ